MSTIGHFDPLKKDLLYWVKMSYSKRNIVCLSRLLLLSFFLICIFMQTLTSCYVSYAYFNSYLHHVASLNHHTIACWYSDVSSNGAMTAPVETYLCRTKNLKFENAQHKLQMNYLFLDFKLQFCNFTIIIVVNFLNNIQKSYLDWRVDSSRV